MIIRYTTNGIDPTPADPGISSGQTVTIASGAVLKARAYRGDLLPSSVTTRAYTLKAARPFFAPAFGPITNGQPISLSCSTPGATIRYTQDGTEPTSSSTVYMGSFAYSSSTTLKAGAFKADFQDSDVAALATFPLMIQNFTRESAFSTFTYQAQSNWNFQIQTAENPNDWRDFGRVQPGTNGVVSVQRNEVPPFPARRLFRIKAILNLGL